MRIDLLLTSSIESTYENYMAKQIIFEFEKLGILYKKVLLFDGVLQDYLQLLEKDPPVTMISFQSILPYQSPLGDLVGVSQLMWVMNSLSEGAHFLTSEYGTLALPNPTNLPRTLYLPHGVKPLTSKKPYFDVIFLSPLVDTNCLRKRWIEVFSDPEIDRINDVITQANLGYSIYELLKNSSDSLTLKYKIGIIEEYLKAKRAYRVITSCRDYPLDVFGDHIGRDWYLRLPNAEGIHLHPSLPYTAHFDLFTESKIVILDPLDTSWRLAAAAGGSLPLRADLEDLHEQVLFYLADDQHRLEALQDYQEEIQNHTWETQVSQLIDHIVKTS
ncbi:MAG: hypothetical protein R3E91_04770 [Chlamydiales bacterium]